MKIRIGLITEDKTAADQIKKDFEGIHIYPATNVMNFYQVIGTNKVDAVVFSGGQSLAQEFQSYYSYLRQKQQFKHTPLAVLCSAAMINKVPMNDCLVRSYPLEEGYFVSLMSFFNAIKNDPKLPSLFDNERVQSAFHASLNVKVTEVTSFQLRPATADEGHAEFLVQSSDEISSNLLWMKFSVRILKESSTGLVSSLSSLSEDDRDKLCNEIITNVFTDFTGEMHRALASDGAFFFNHSDSMAMPDKSAFIKQAKAQAMVFESNYCCFLVEFIRYI